MIYKFQVWGLFLLFFQLIMACDDYNCPNCNPDDERPEWLPDGAMRDPRGLPIHAIRIWETRHMFAFEKLYECNTMDLCITTNSSVIPKVKYVRGELITSDGQINKSFYLELWNSDELIGVYCHRLLIDEQYSPNLARYRSTIVDHDWNWNQRSMNIQFVPYK